MAFGSSESTEQILAILHKRGIHTLGQLAAVSCSGCGNSNRGTTYVRTLGGLRIGSPLRRNHRKDFDCVYSSQLNSLTGRQLQVAQVPAPKRMSVLRRTLAMPSPRSSTRRAAAGSPCSSPKESSTRPALSNASIRHVGTDAP